jgi:uncharacterized protein YecE (DUF72 family)
MASRSGTIRVGIGGWVFPEWRGVFYPKGLTQAKELNYASQHVTSIEINSTFYRAQSPTSYRKWAGDTPDDFVFSLKAPRVTTHRRELVEARQSVERFIASGIVELGAKLGPILWQFPPFKKFDPADFGAFLGFLPAEHAGHRLRHAVEVRHESFVNPAFVDMLRDHNVALAMIESEKHPLMQDVTADFLYARLEGTQEKVTTGYPPKALDQWAERFQTWAAGGEPEDAVRVNAKAKPAKTPRDCYVYFISGAKVRNPAAAQAFIERIK